MQGDPDQAIGGGRLHEDLSRDEEVIGASDRRGSVGRAVFRNLLAGGFDGPVYPVNPTTPHVASVPSFAAVTDI